MGGAPEGEKYSINAMLREQNSNYDSSRFWDAVEKELNKKLDVEDAELAL